MESLRENEANLLTLPRSDVGLSMPDSFATTYPSLLLLQLPPKWQVQDIQDARFVIPHQQQASLVVEQAETSFALQRVETSNALVLVPPAMASKRRKVTDQGGIALPVVTARVLQKGVGAFFLQPQVTPCRLADLRALLPVWDPLASPPPQPPPPSISLHDLGNALAKSRSEIVAAVAQLQAVTCGEGNYYCRLTEEARLDVLDAVLATLVEAFPDYAKQGVNVAEFTIMAQQRLVKALQSQASPVLIHHALSTLTEQTKIVPHQTLSLNVALVGAAVASRILIRQDVWEESLFLATWQAEMPGVDTVVQSDWLRGQALRYYANDGRCHYYKYLPASALVETDSALVVWERLVHAQPEWTHAALQPYLDAWQVYTGQVPATILRHAAVRQEGDVTIYYARGG